MCNRNLDTIGNASEQEVHVKNCLEGGSGTTPQTAKYLVYSLPAESTLIGVECELILLVFAMMLIAVAHSRCNMPGRIC